MVYCIQAQLAFSTAARRNTVLADMQSRISTKPRWQADVLEAASFRFGVNGIRAEVRFITQADADDLKARVESFATGVRAPIAGSWLTVHSCTHDEDSDTCTALARTDW